MCDATDNTPQLLVFLLMLTLLTVWRFKVRKYFFLHETGVSMLIGACCHISNTW